MLAKALCKHNRVMVLLLLAPSFFCRLACDLCPPLRDHTLSALFAALATKLDGCAFQIVALV